MDGEWTHVRGYGLAFENEDAGEPDAGKQLWAFNGLQKVNPNRTWKENKKNFEIKAEGVFYSLFFVFEASRAASSDLTYWPCMG